MLAKSKKIENKSEEAISKEEHKINEKQIDNNKIAEISNLSKNNDKPETIYSINKDNNDANNNKIKNDINVKKEDIKNKNIKNIINIMKPMFNNNIEFKEIHKSKSVDKFEKKYSFNDNELLQKIMQKDLKYMEANENTLLSNTLENSKMIK